jgi:hypothetical protein
LLKVRSGGQDFITGIEFLMQAEFMSELIRAAPQVYKNRSGGLLAAMVRTGDYDVLEVSEEVQKAIIWEK